MLTDRSKVGLTTSRSQGLPQLRKSSTESTRGFLTGRSLPPAASPELWTPYRLPKLLLASAGAEAGPEEQTPAVYTRYGFSNCTTDSPCESGVDFQHQKGPASVFAGPSFSQAVVAPVWSPLMEPRPTAAGTQVQPMEHPDKGSRRKDGKFPGNRSKTSCTHFSAFGSTIHRSPTVFGGWDPAASQQQQQQQQQGKNSGEIRPAGDGSLGTDERRKPVGWVMRPLRRFQVDRKGQQLNQGPFSREFTVHARAPQNWLKMKWGRN